MKKKNIHIRTHTQEGISTKQPRRRKKYTAPLRKKKIKKITKREKQEKEEKTSTGVCATHPPGDLPLPLSLILFFFPCVFL